MNVLTNPIWYIYISTDIQIYIYLCACVCVCIKSSHYTPYIYTMLLVNYISKWEEKKDLCDTWKKYLSYLDVRQAIGPWFGPLSSHSFTPSITQQTSKRIRMYVCVYVQRTEFTEYSKMNPAVLTGGPIRPGLPKGPEAPGKPVSPFSPSSPGRPLPPGFPCNPVKIFKKGKAVK